MAKTRVPKDGKQSLSWRLPGIPRWTRSLGLSSCCWEGPRDLSEFSVFKEGSHVLGVGEEDLRTELEFPVCLTEVVVMTSTRQNSGGSTVSCEGRESTESRP